MHVVVEVWGGVHYKTALSAACFHSHHIHALFKSHLLNTANKVLNATQEGSLVLLQKDL